MEENGKTYVEERKFFLEKKKKAWVYDRIASSQGCSKLNLEIYKACGLLNYLKDCPVTYLFSYEPIIIVTLTNPNRYYEV